MSRKTNAAVRSRKRETAIVLNTHTSPKTKIAIKGIIEKT